MEIHFLAAPVKVIAENGRMTAIESIKMELGEPDESGRRRPVKIEGSEFLIQTDTLIPAVSQSPDKKLADQIGLKTTRWETIETDEVTMATEQEGIFAGGDVVLGPSSVIEAIAHGKRAAAAINNYLSGRPIGEGIKKPEERENPLSKEDIEKLKEKTSISHRIHPQELSVEDRIKTFNEVERLYTEEEAIAEASRCLNCADCCECYRCVEVCQARGYRSFDG